MRLVLDSSIVGCWVLPDEASPVADAAAAGALLAEDVVVPALWWFEVRNILVIGERRGRIQAAATPLVVAELDQLPVRVDREPRGDVILALARDHRLTFYDATYLELALRMTAAVATLDRALAAAARAMSVEVFGDPPHGSS